MKDGRREGGKKQRDRVRWQLPLACLGQQKLVKGCGDLGSAMPWWRGDRSKEFDLGNFTYFPKICDMYWFVILAINFLNYVWANICICTYICVIHMYIYNIYISKHGPPIWNYSSEWQVEKCKSWDPPPSSSKKKHRNVYPDKSWASSNMSKAIM